MKLHNIVSTHTFKNNGSAHFQISRFTSFCLHSLKFFCNEISINFCGVFCTKLKPLKTETIELVSW